MQDFALQNYKVYCMQWRGGKKKKRERGTIILSGNHWLPLPVISIVILTQPSQSTARISNTIAVAGSDKR